MIQWEQLCSVDFEVYLRACATFSSETAEIQALEWKNPIRERWSNENSYLLSTLRCFYVSVQLSPWKQRKIRVLDWKTLSERDDPVRTAMFCRFCGVSTCVCNFLLGNSGDTSSRVKKPYPRVMIQWEQLCSVNLDVFLRACATFSLETAEIRVLEWKPFPRKMIQWEQLCSVNLDVFLRAWATFSLETAEKRVLDWKNPIRERWSSENSYVLSILEVYLRACATFSLETAEIRVLDWKTLSERDDPVRAMFCQFGGISTCVRNFLLRNSLNTSARLKNPTRERWSSENSYVLSILWCIYVRVQLSPRKQRRYEFWSEKTLSERDDPMRTALFCQFGRVSTCVSNFLLRNSGNSSPRLKKPIREKWSSENSYVLSILWCIYVRVQLSPQKQQKYEFSTWKPYPREMIQWEQLCSVDFEVIYVLVQLSSQKQRKYQFSSEKTLSERDNPVRTAMFFRFWGVSTCVCIFLLRNSGNTGSWLENPIRERWSSESSFVLSSRKMFRWENDFVPAIPEWTAE